MSLSLWRDPLGLFRKQQQRYGPVFLLRLLNKPTLCITSYTAAREALLDTSQSLSAANAYRPFAAGLYDTDCVLLADAAPPHGHNKAAAGSGSSCAEPSPQLHALLRRAMAPVFNAEAVRGNSDVVVSASRQALRAAVRHLALNADGGGSASCDLYELLKEAATRASLSVFLALDSEAEQEDAYRRLVAPLKDHWHGMMAAPLAVDLSFLGFKSAKSAKVVAREARQELLQELRAALARVKVCGDDAAAGAAGAVAWPAGSCLAAVARALEGAPLEADSSGEEASSAGDGGDRASSAAAEQFLLFSSALIPKAIAAVLVQLLRRLLSPTEAALLAQLRALLSSPAAADESSGDELADASDSLLDRCILEAERLHPPFLAVRRMVRPNMQATVAGYAVDGDTPVMAVLPLANQDEDVYGPDAAEFRPARWAVHPAPPPPLTYGHGAHACIGRHLVRIFARSFLTELLRDYDMQPERDDADGDLDTSASKWLPVSRPREAILVQITRKAR
jgi:cytochrome P450